MPGVTPGTVTDFPPPCPLRAGSGAGIWIGDRYFQSRTGAKMSTFDDRENAFESKFAHDAQMQFKAEARRNKLLGLWAADLLGRSGDAAMAYAKEVISADFEEAGDEDVYRKVKGDLGDKVSEKDLRTKMAELTVTAKKQLLDEV